MRKSMVESSRQKKYPSFFKVYLPQHSSEKMQIPVAFLMCLNRTLPQDVILRSPERSWRVKVVQSGNEAFFQRGWKGFVQENAVQATDFIVFKYDGGHIFDIEIFGPSGCLKEPAALQIKEEEEESEAKMAEEEVDSEEVQDIEDESDYIPDTTDEEQDDYESDYIPDTTDKEQDDYGLTDNDGSANDNEEMNETNDRSGLAYEDENMVEKNEFLWARSHLGDTQNPFFVSKLAPGSKKKLYFPSKIIRDFNLQLPEEVLFLDERGREWRGKVSRWRDGRIWIGGWSAICKWNQVTPNHKCICELLLGRERFTMQVHIVPPPES